MDGSGTAAFIMSRESCEEGQYGARGGLGDPDEDTSRAGRAGRGFLLGFSS